MGKAKDITSQKFGRLTAIKCVGINNHHKFLWECLCECGNKKIVPTGALISGNTKSCGCLHSEKLIEQNKTHNASKTLLYKIWCAMKERCLNEKSKYYNHYGGRGIEISGIWINSFENFRDWAMLNGYQEGLSIERKNVDGNYEPNNCCWIKLGEQTRNKSNSIYLTINGETKLLIDFAMQYNLSPLLLRQRYHKGIRNEEILNPPKDSKFKHGHPRYGGKINNIKLTPAQGRFSYSQI